MKDIPIALLPNGFADLLPPEAEQEATAVSVLMETFSAFGYNRVKPPLLEFEDSLLAPGPGAALAQETFRVMDPVSHRMMGLRSDITPQTARIAASRLANEKRPLRLAYANDVLRTKGNQQRTERQFCQVGCELIGSERSEAEIETCMLALLGLRALDLKPVTIDLATPRLIDTLFTVFDIAEPARKDIRTALARKAGEALAEIDGQPLQLLLTGLLKASGEAEKALPALLALDLPQEAESDIQELESVYAGLKKGLEELGLKDISVTIDPLENKGFEYHSGIGFTLFAKNVRGELGRGGRYDVCFGNQGESETAAGFTLYMDTIRKALPSPAQKDRIYVSAGESWETIASLQKEGWTVLRGTRQADEQEACTHIYKDGKIEKVAK